MGCNAGATNSSGIHGSDPKQPLILSLAAAAAAEEKPRKREVAPRWHVAQAEFDSVSAYLKGRLTIDKVHYLSRSFAMLVKQPTPVRVSSHQVNTAVEELAVHAEANHKLLAALRSTTQKLSGAERKRAAELVHAMAVSISPR